MNTRCLVAAAWSVVAYAGLGCSQQAEQTAAPAQTAGYVEPSPADAASPQHGAHTAVVYVKGLSCPLCVQAIRKELGAVPGVRNIDINYEEEFATLTLSERKPPSRKQLTDAVARSGYTLTRIDMN